MMNLGGWQRRQCLALVRPGILVRYVPPGTSGSLGRVILRPAALLLVILRPAAGLLIVLRPALLPSA
jgi:hypothetical protein